MGKHAFPAELAAVAWKKWRAAQPCVGVLPDEPVLERLLSVAYQASLLREEDRPVRFRLFVGDPASVPADSGPPEGLHRLMFTTTRAFDEHEIARLSPAAKFHRALIGVARAADDFRIWGVLQSGPRWLESTRGGRAPASPIPRDALVVSALDVGHIVLSVGDQRIAELRGGRITGSALDIFDARWMRAQFDHYRSDLLAQHAAQMTGDGALLDPEGLRTISQQMVKRLLATMRDASHGGMIVYVPHDRVPKLLQEALHIKYAFIEDDARRRYHHLMLGVMRELSLAGAEMIPRPERVGYELYQHSARPGIIALDEAIFEMSQLLAGLADVDGAVILTDRLEVLGFGGEITGWLPDVTTVKHAHDLEAHVSHSVTIDEVGTRHRSAYRLCAHEEGCLAIVVSHDGGVQFVKQLRGEVTYWDHGQVLL